MRLYSSTLRRVLDSLPGKKRMGMYRFLPLFFVLGAALEFSMINWTVGETNFYKTFKKRQAKNIVEEKVFAGVSWGQYLKFFSCAMLSMMAGAQCVHLYYKPMNDIEVYIEKEMKNLNISELNLEDRHNKDSNKS